MLQVLVKVTAVFTVTTALGLWLVVFVYVYKNNRKFRLWVLEPGNYIRLLVLIAISVLTYMAWVSPLDSTLGGLRGELTGIAFTVFFIDFSVRAESAVRRKRELFDQVKSPVRDIAVEALRLIRSENGWFEEMLEKYNHNLRGVQWQGADLHGAQLERANLQGAQLEGANLSDAQLVWAILSGAHLERASLSEIHLERANLVMAHLEGANLSEAYLEGANLSKALLEGANLSGAQLQGAYLIKTNLEGADLSWANLSGADLFGANLHGANFFLIKHNEKTRWPVGFYPNGLPLRHHDESGDDAHQHGADDETGNEGDD